MRLPIRVVGLVAALLLAWWWLDPTTAAPLAATCIPRPPVAVSVTSISVGTLQATIGAATGAGVTLQQIAFNGPTNALIDVPGRPPGDPNPAPVDVTGQSFTSFNFR